ncbi:DUF6090 family protein [Rasiella sp. SM2506]|uniref:DUF6090 family protein n=1 Tax=Rasiella sp. SM2506 TaxID=3423914 RepID=UPI003D797B32
MIKLFRHIRKRLVTENKFSKYLLYAIGEIILVVIGILIALSLNNWNTEDRNKKIVTKNSKILIENLEKDSVFCKSKILAIQKQENDLSSLQARLSSRKATLDTLIKIARYEFNPLALTINFQNENAYKTMVLSGEVNLFDSQLTQTIYDLYRKHEFIEKVSEDNFKVYVDAVQNYQESYSLNVGINTINGPLQDLLWQDVSAKDLIAKFDKLTVAKRINYGRKADLEKMLKETSALLVELRKIENQ